jgi:alkanesulfonate monooxygenase SsuD/methylene tetrahydromethanopterin reductase-like flavin-dependent oxidoreductase (luciferase family)
MLGFNVFAADSDDEAELLATSMQQAFVAIRTGQGIELPPPVPGYRATLDAQGQAMLDQVLSASATGGPETVKRRLAEFVARTGADELMLVSAIFDHDKRKHSLSIAAEAMRGL